MIKRAATEFELQKALDIRYEVEFAPQGLSRTESLKYDLNDNPISVVCWQDEQVVGVATAFIIADGESQLMYLAVLPEYQKQGIGRRLVAGLEKELIELGVRQNKVMARTYLQKFYGSMGYVPIGEQKQFPEFVEKGIYHQNMLKSL